MTTKRFFNLLVTVVLCLTLGITPVSTALAAEADLDDLAVAENVETYMEDAEGADDAVEEVATEETVEAIEVYATEACAESMDEPGAVEHYWKKYGWDADSHLLICACGVSNCPLAGTDSRGSHDFSDWSVLEEPTQTEPGRKVRSCWCGYSEYVTIPASAGDSSDEESQGGNEGQEDNKTDDSQTDNSGKEDDKTDDSQKEDGKGEDGKTDDSSKEDEGNKGNQDNNSGNSGNTDNKDENKTEVKPTEKPEEKPTEKPEEKPAGNQTGGNNSSQNSNNGSTSSNNTGGSSTGTNKQPAIVTPGTATPIPTQTPTTAPTGTPAATTTPTQTPAATAATTPTGTPAAVTTETPVTVTPGAITNNVTVVTVVQPVEQIKVKTNKITVNRVKTIKIGKKVKLQAYSGIARKNFTWKISNKKYAKLSKDGVITAKKAGKGKTIKVTATAKKRSGNTVTKVTLIYKIKIKK